VDLATIRERVQAGNYLIRSHAVIHALKEGFAHKDMVAAILTGTIIEEYPDDERVLICGRAVLTETVTVYVHVVCEYTDAIYIEVITAYLPDPDGWENPPLRRRKHTRN
jgi:Domain of unknown function (DUF4258)